MRLSKLRLSIGAFLVMLSLAVAALVSISFTHAHAAPVQHATAHAATAQNIQARAEALRKARSKRTNSACSSRSDFYASPCSVTETTAGNVSYALIGSKLVPLTAYTIYAPTLAKACSGGTSIDGATVVTDFTGSFNDVGTGVACVAGHYTIELQDNLSPYTVYSTVLTIRQP